MQAGDLVRIKRSEKLLNPWRGYALNGVAMTVKNAASRDPSAPPRIKVVDPVSLRHEWFDGDELELLRHGRRP